MRNQTELFPVPAKPRQKRRVMMHVADAGNWGWHTPWGGKCIRFECSKCGHDTDWIDDNLSVTENKRGMPCPICNEGEQS